MAPEYAWLMYHAHGGIFCHCECTILVFSRHLIYPMLQMKTENDLVTKIQKLVSMLNTDPAYCVLTGAGCSTASGLPAYRNIKGDWQHDKPMEHQDFLGSELKRKIYWSRSQQGWPGFSKARPNQTHKMLTQLQRNGYISQIITQNVDRLHQASGSKAVIDLHGRLDQVICLGCSKKSSRDKFQQRLVSVNHVHCSTNGDIRPDGDVEISTEALSGFLIPECEHCHGVLKPDVVFFGGILNANTAADALNAVDNAPGLIVVGSSLMVYSGFRLVKRAIEMKKPVIIINQGTTRADDLRILKINYESGRVLTDVGNALSLE